MQEKLAPSPASPTLIATDEDPHLTRIRRKLVRLMLASIIITFVLVGLVLLGVIYKIMQNSSDSAPLIPTQAPIEQQIILGSGYAIRSYKVAGDTIILHATRAGTEDELIIYNYRLGQIVARLKFPDAQFFPNFKSFNH